MSDLKPSTDLELMLHVRQGDLGALGELFERHHAGVYRYAVRRLGNAAAAEDLVQEVFLRVLKYRGTFRADSAHFGAWLYSLARNASRDHHRRRRDHDPLPDGPAELASEESSVAERIEREEEAGVLRQCLQQLPEKYREVLILSRYERRKYREIAQILGCSVGTVKVRVHRAVRQLREIYNTTASEVAS